MHKDETDYKRIFLAVFLAAIVLIGWQIKVEWPRRQALAQLHTQTTQKRSQESATHAEKIPAKGSDGEENASLSREQRIAASPRIRIQSDKLQGSIALTGARFDDLILPKYRVSIEKDSPAVTLLSPSGDKEAWFVQTGWLSEDNKTKVPDQKSVWESDKKTLSSGETAHLSWNNGEGVTFLLAITLDDDYMFRLAQSIENHSGQTVTLLPYAYVNRTYQIPEQAAFLHEGPIGAMDGTLNEVGYKQIIERGNVTFESSEGWFGITDHYWLAALIPDAGHKKITFGHYSKGGRDRFQTDYLGDALTVADGAKTGYNVRLFAGAKELRLLNRYAGGTNDQPPIPLFDRALDFGWFYFLAKPMCLMVDYLYVLTGNFGTALLLFIIALKLALFPMADKSYKSMAQMRKLQPEMLKIRERYSDDQIAMHKATRELYKREKVNPAAGCLPILIQLIVFLALFRGLNVSIEMRHAPFYGWIHDLSAPDPSNLFTLFGLLPWNHPSWMHLGLLPILYTITMIIQTAQQPTPPDPIQAKMIKWMPYFFLFIFDKMASGFVLYWAWSNVLSIFQQYFINRRHGDPKAQTAKAKDAASDI